MPTNKLLAGLTSAAVASLLVLTHSSAAKPTLLSKATTEWSQFRGPNGTGVAETTGLPVEFGPTKNVVWKTELPPGHSSPVLTRDRIFVTAYQKIPTATARRRAHAFQASPIEKENYKLLVIALDRASGKIVWQREVPRTRTGRLQNVNNPASPSPVTDGTNVYIFFQEFGLISYDRSGKERWKLQIGRAHV